MRSLCIFSIQLTTSVNEIIVYIFFSVFMAKVEEYETYESSYDEGKAAETYYVWQYFIVTSNLLPSNQLSHPRRHDPKKWMQG